MVDYRYPDTGDRITNVFLQQEEPYPGYWETSERRALDLVAGRLDGVFGPRGETRGLDAGCGHGRLLPWIARFAGQVVGVDADPARLALARTFAETVDADVTMLDGAIEDLGNGPFDLVVCSHLIQHMVTTRVPRLLGRLHALTAPGGYLLISYRRAGEAGERFGVRTLENGQIVEEALDRGRFDELCARTADVEMLPVREVDPGQLAGMARGLGWTETWSWTYHVLDDLGVVDEYVHRDELVNATPSLRRALGQDMMALWRRD